MTEILPTASYVQNLDALGLHGNQENALKTIARHSLFDSAETIRRIWKLLETPQTVETICRVLTHEYQVEDEGCQREVCSLLAEMFRTDLIRLSPDS